MDPAVDEGERTTVEDEERKAEFDGAKETAVRDPEVRTIWAAELEVSEVDILNRKIFNALGIRE